MISELSEIFAKIRSVGMVPALIEPRNTSQNDLKFIGTIEEYLEIVRARGGRVIFVFTHVLGEEDFVEDNEDNEDDEDSDAYDDEVGMEANNIDLCFSNNGLEKFKELIGKIGIYVLCCDIDSRFFVFSDSSDWWADFLKIRSEALSIRRRLKVQSRVDRVRENEARVEELKKKLRSLMGDQRFLKLPTQQAMKEYALMHFEELSELDDYDLKIEIRKMKAQMQARGK